MIHDPMPTDVQLALGRLLRMMSRPSQPGDVAMFHKIVAVVTDAHDERNGQRIDYRPSYAAQRLMGARGDA